MKPAGDKLGLQCIKVYNIKNHLISNNEDYCKYYLKTKIAAAAMMTTSTPKLLNVVEYIIIVKTTGNINSQQWLHQYYMFIYKQVVWFFSNNGCSWVQAITVY